MTATTISLAPNLSIFLKSLKESPNVEFSIQSLVSLLKRRRIRGSRQCATATAHLLKQVIRKFKARDASTLIKRVQDVGQRLTDAQPKELAVSNIIRRVLGLIRDEAEGNKDNDLGQSFPTSEPGTPRRRGASPQQSQLNGIPTIFDPEPFHRPPLLTSHTSYAASTNAPTVTSMFNLLSQPVSESVTPGNSSPASQSQTPLNSQIRPQDLSKEVQNGIDEIIDELENMDDQIAAYATDHIHSNEIILTHGSSLTVQRFLLRAASKRKFTVIHAEGYPNEHKQSHATVTGKHHNDTSDTSDDALDSHRFAKPLINAGITVILIPDAAVFALMSRVNKVILGTHAILANGGLIAAAGTKSIALAAREHRTPVVVVTGVYKLCPTFVFDFDSLIEYGEPGAVLGYGEDGDIVDKVDVENPLNDYIEGDLVDLFITNLGGHAPFSLSSVIEEQYRSEDTDLAAVASTAVA